MTFALVLTASEIEDEFLARSGIQIDLRDLFWPEGVANDSFKSLYYGKDLSEDVENYELKNKVYKFLRNWTSYFQCDGALVDVSW